MMLRIGRWNVRIIRKGDRYGAGDCLVHGDTEGAARHADGEKPMVEFYDATQSVEKFGERGQFTGGRYYIETLRQDRKSLEERGLNFHGGVPEWCASGSEMYAVFRWLDKVAQESG